MMADLDKANKLLETLFIDPCWDTPSVKGLIELTSEILLTCIRNAIKKITIKGYTEEVAEKAILTSGPYHDSEGNIESNIAERALLSLESNKEDDDSSSYAFPDLSKLVDYMTFMMVNMVRDLKSVTVHEATWSLLLCDLNVREASKAELDLPQTVTFAKPEVGSGSQSGSKNPETTAEKCHESCKCRTLTVVANNRRNVAHRQTATLLIEKPYKGRKRGLTKKYGCLKGNLAVSDKFHSCPLSSSSSSSSSEQNKNTSLPVKLTEKIAPKPEVQAKTEDDYLKSIPRNEKGEYLPQGEKDEMMLDIVAQKQELQKELQRWNDWTNTKVMQVTKRMTQIRQEMKKLKAEKEGANKLDLVNEAVEENKAKRLSETTRALTTANAELKAAATSAIEELQTEQSAIMKELEALKKRSLSESKKLSEAFKREDEAFKKSQSFAREKASLEEDLKSVKRQVGPIQRELEKAKRLLKETEIRVAKEEQETAKVVNEAESVKKEREGVEDLAKAEQEKVKEEAEEELKKYETEKKRIEYEISVFKKEAENKRIAAMQKSMNTNMDSSKRLQVCRNMGLKEKKDRECVMCLHEEVTVVFVPCCHQVLCEGCNVKHEKEYNDCPFCMGTIQKRISARFPKSGKLDG